MNMMPLDRWVEMMSARGVTKVTQTTLLGLADESHIYKMLHEAENILVDDDTLSIWRRVKLKSMGEYDGNERNVSTGSSQEQEGGEVVHSADTRQNLDNG
jgi:hypothetical protein